MIYFRDALYYKLCIERTYIEKVNFSSATAMHRQLCGPPYLFSFGWHRFPIIPNFFVFMLLTPLTTTHFSIITSTFLHYMHLHIFTNLDSRTFFVLIAVSSSVQLAEVGRGCTWIQLVQP